MQKRRGKIHGRQQKFLIIHGNEKIYASKYDYHDIPELFEPDIKSDRILDAPIKMSDVLNALRNMKPNKAPGYDQIKLEF